MAAGPVIIALAPLAAQVLTSIFGKEAAGQQQLDQLKQQSEEWKRQLDEVGADKEKLNKQIAANDEATKAIYEQLKDEQSYEPKGSIEELRKESRDKHKLDPGRFNVLFYGSVKNGKSTLGNWLARLRGQDKFKTGLTPISKDGMPSEKRQSRRHDLITYADVEGAGSEGNQAKSMIKERKPAGFDLVLLVINTAVMDEDAALAIFCNKHGIPFYFVSTKADVNTAMADDGFEQVKEQVTAHVKDVLTLRECWRDDVLVFVDGKHGDQENFEEPALLAAIEGKLAAWESSR